jgi:hypothetical protein
LFLTHRGYANLTQEKGRNGRILLKDLWKDDDDFTALTERLNPEMLNMEGFADV